MGQLPRVILPISAMMVLSRITLHVVNVINPQVVIFGNEMPFSSFLRFSCFLIYLFFSQGWRFSGDGIAISFGFIDFWMFLKLIYL